MALSMHCVMYICFAVGKKSRPLIGGEGVILACFLKSLYAAIFTEGKK